MQPPQFDDLFTGKLIRLTAQTADDAEAFARWSANIEYHRLVDDDPARPLPIQHFAKQFEGSPGSNHSGYDFMIRTIAENTLIGFVVLHSIKWSNRAATVSIGIGESAYWGQGYGTEAMQLALAFAFRELNLYRVGLSVLGYNTRAIRSYEKVGFVHEGGARSAVERDGRRYDHLTMGILRDEWLAKNEAF